ncbi:hypothetical protein ACTFUH_000959 [Vibrio cholerae]
MEKPKKGNKLIKKSESNSNGIKKELILYIGFSELSSKPIKLNDENESNVQIINNMLHRVDISPFLSFSKVSTWHEKNTKGDTAITPNR